MAKAGAQPSFVLVFSLAATLIGSTNISLPWVISQSGLILGPILIVFVGLLSAYSGHLILKNSKGYFDFGIKCRDTLGKWSEVLAQIISVVMMISAQISLHIFLSQNVFSLVNAFISFAKGVPPAWWKREIAALIILALEFPLTLLTNLKFIIRLSSFGFIAVLAVSVIVIVTGVTPPGGITLDGATMFSTNFPISLGVLSVSFFIHNMLSSMFHDARSPKHNPINLFLGFFIDILIYTSVGVAGYLGYHHFPDPITGECRTVPDNYLLCFSSTNVWAFVARIFLTLQMLITWPVMFRQMRSSFFEGFFPKCAIHCGAGCVCPRRQIRAHDRHDETQPLLDNLPAESREVRTIERQAADRSTGPVELNFWIHILPFAIVFMGITTLFALFYPSVGNILRFAGALSGFVYIYLLPTLVEAVVQYRKMAIPEPSMTPDPNGSINQDLNLMGKSEDVVTKRSFVWTVTKTTLMIIYGLAVLAFQFVFRAK
ncbi:Transmembrane amino acid transporter [Blattamonas nauphoetae]|uniref:Transmembrane amino acid transporter n=1 Tax=Blattamonas nauphoetae TaxID=2049346 RepID=A0ABQ9Y0E7_9EUKA|nr:Transmembrane amino acid transporter [Blattamonas nauphoetae]